MSEDTESPVRTNWFSPRRLHDSPTPYDFPGDRFIPNRSLMNLDHSHSLLTNNDIKEVCNSGFSESYHENLKRSLTLDLEGRPFKMLVFRGSPKSSRRSSRLIDEMRRDDAEVLNNKTKQSPRRCIPKKEARILDAPHARDDFYLNILDWGSNNTLAVALGSEIYLWRSENSIAKRLLRVSGNNDFPTSVAWSADAGTLAIGYNQSALQLWDVQTSKCIQKLEGHTNRVGTISWKGHTVTSGNRIGSIINHDVRVGNNPTSCIKAHGRAVCGLKWSSEGNLLASGGNDNTVYIWERSKMSSSNFLHRFTDHSGAIKALAWCPYQFGILASGGGTYDGCIKIWNTQRGACIDSIDTKAQICGLEWNRHHNEILSGHGFGLRETANHLKLWKYPLLTKMGKLHGHTSRVINLSQTPDGLTAVSIGADETIRFWDIFGPRNENPPLSGLDGLLSLKISPVR